MEQRGKGLEYSEEMWSCTSEETMNQQGKGAFVCERCSDHDAKAPLVEWDRVGHNRREGRGEDRAPAVADHKAAQPKR